MSQSRWCHSQGGVTVKVVSRARWCHSQGGVTVKVLSQLRWYHNQGVVTVKVASQSKWCHSQGGVTAKVVSQTRWYHKQGGVTDKVVPQSTRPLLDGSINRSPLYPCMTNDVHVNIATTLSSDFMTIATTLRASIKVSQEFTISRKMFITVTNVHRQTNVHPQGKYSPVGHMFIGGTNAQMCACVCV